MFYNKKIRAHSCIPYEMYGHVSVRSPPGRTWAITRVKRVDIHVHAVPGRVYGGWALFRAFTVCFNFQAAASPCLFMPLYSSRYLCDDRILPETRMSCKLCSVFHNPSFMLDSITANKIQYKLD